MGGAFAKKRDAMLILILIFSVRPLIFANAPLNRQYPI